MDMDIECDCGNPACHARTEFRKGYVNIGHPDGREEVRWDWFYIFSVDYEDGDSKSRIVEVMTPPCEARTLMWFLIANYMPGVSWCVHVFYRARRHIMNTAWRIARRLRKQKPATVSHDD